MEHLKTEDNIAAVEVYLVPLVQDKPYLGDLQKGEEASAQGYFVRSKNRTVYTLKNRTIVVRVLTAAGIEGWGETYGLAAPRATAEIIKDLFTGFLLGRNPLDVERIYEDLYDLMRVRGYSGGYYHDALAAVDIAIWDIVGKIMQQPLTRVLGGQRRAHIPAYISGLPESSLDKRCELALAWQEKGFSDFKFALPAADQGAKKELKELRRTLGEDSRIAVDLHWSRTRGEAALLSEELRQDQPWFLEAPISSEDIDGLAWVAKKSSCAVAVGEEWRTVYDAKLRIDREACQIIQPEMAHTGVTQFMRICRYAEAYNLAIIPHATIGAGLFLAASLQVSATLQNVRSHEYQHSIFGDFLHFTDGDLKCEQGQYSVSSNFGIGVTPSDEMKSQMTQL